MTIGWKYCQGIVNICTILVFHSKYLQCKENICELYADKFLFWCLKFSFIIILIFFRTLTTTINFYFLAPTHLYHQCNEFLFDRSARFEKYLFNIKLIKAIFSQYYHLIENISNVKLIFVKNWRSVGKFVNI